MNRHPGLETTKFIIWRACSGICATHGTTLCIIDHKVAFLAKFADQAIALQQGCKIAEGRRTTCWLIPAVVKAYLGRSHHA